MAVAATAHGEGDEHDRAGEHERSAAHPDADELTAVATRARKAVGCAAR